MTEPRVHFLFRSDHRLACSATAPERARTTHDSLEVTCRNCLRALAASRWWEPPSDEAVREGLIELAFLDAEEIGALVEHAEREVWVRQQLIPHMHSEGERQRCERWLSYYQTRVRQYKRLEAEADSRFDDPTAADPRRVGA